MRRIIFLLLLYGTSIQAQTDKKQKAIFLEDISWSEAARVLTPDAVVVIPMGAAAKEHGRHMPLSADFLQAEYLKAQVAANQKVIITPSINYGFYPAFLRYAGSTSLRYSSARDIMLEIVRELADYGPKRFYVINVGISTNFPLAETAATLAREGILFTFSNYDRLQDLEDEVRTKNTGTHADEIETSNILFIAPKKVDMSQAADDTTGAPGKGRIALTPEPRNTGAHSPSGVYGYARLATKEKGKKFMEGMARVILHEIDSVRAAALTAVADLSATLSQYAGTYTSGDGKKIVIKAGPYYLDYVWQDVDHSNFFRLYYYSPDIFASQVIDIIFLKENGKVEKAICHFRGAQSLMTKAKE